MEAHVLTHIVELLMVDRYETASKASLVCTIVALCIHFEILYHITYVCPPDFR